MLEGKRVSVIGGSTGVGRAVVESAHRQGAQTLAVARRREPLDRLAAALPGLSVLALDATDDNAPEHVFAQHLPDVLVLVGNAPPVPIPFVELDWESFAAAWDSDVRASFLFCRAALQAPLAPGAVVVMISSGAALGGSPLSGGYAGAKRMQMFMADYCQSESDRLGLDLHFFALAPLRPMIETEGGARAISAYAARQGVSTEAFLRAMGSRQTPDDVAKAVLALASARTHAGRTQFTVSPDGLRELQ